MKKITLPRISPELSIALVLSLMLLVLPFFILERWYIGGFTIMISIVVIVIAWIRTTPKFAVTIKSLWVDYVFIAFLVVATISTIYSAVRKESVDGLFLLIAAGMLFFLARTLARHSSVVFMAGSSIVTGIITTVTALSIAVQIPEVSLRIYGPFRNPDGFGPSLIVPLFFCLGLFFFCKRPWQRILLIIATVVLGGALLMASAMSSIIGIVVASSIGIAVMRIRPSGKILMLGCATFVVAVGLMLFFRQSFLHQQSTAVNLTGFTTSSGAVNSYRQRLSFAQTSFDMARAHPLTGVGQDLWMDFFPQYQHSILEQTQTPHGYIFKVLGELGWPGAILFSLLFLSICLNLARVARRPSATPIIRFGAIGVVGLGIAAMIDIPWGYSANFMLFWVYAGMLVAPTTVEVNSKKAIFSTRAILLLLSGLMLIYGFLRFTGSYLVNQVHQAAVRHDAIDVIATAGIAKHFLVSPRETSYMAALFNISSFPADQETAKNWFEESLRQNPYQPAVYRLLGTLVQGQKDVQRAEALYRKGLSIDPYFDPELAEQLGKLLVDQKRYTEARDVTTTMLSHVGGTVSDRDKHIAILAKISAASELELGMRDAALEHLKLALQLAPTEQDVRTLLREVFQQNIEATVK